MKRAFVPVTRRFRVLKDEETAGTPSRRIRQQLGDRGLTWKELLSDEKARAIVLVSPSGAGKTAEFTEQLVPSSRNAGQHVAYATARTFMEHGLGLGLGSEESRAVSQWRGTTAPLLLVIDAVDELNLTHHRFVDVTRRLRSELDQASGRVRLLFGVRTGGWKDSAAAALTQYLARTAPEGTQEAAEAFKLVAFDALDEDAIATFATAWVLHEPKEFVRALDAERIDDLFELRPLEIDVFARYWEKHRGFASWARLISAYVEDVASEDRHGSPLVPADFRIAVQRIAAATEFCERAQIAVPGANGVENALNSWRLFDDWPGDRVTALFETPLFQQKGTDAVQLPAGSISDYLAAKWLAERVRAGLSVELLESHLFVRVFGETKERLPRKREKVAGWLCGLVPALRPRLRAINPGLILHGGDPDNLRDEDIKACLDALVASDQPNARGIYARNAVLRRIARPSLESFVAGKLSLELSDGLARYFFDLAGEGKFASCIEPAMRVAQAHDRDAHLRAAAIELLGRCAGPTHLSQLRPLLDDEDDEVRAALLEALAPTHLNRNALAAFLVGGAEYRMLAALRSTVDNLDRADFEAFFDLTKTKLSPSILTKESKPLARVAGAMSAAALRKRFESIPSLVDVLDILDGLGRNGAHYLDTDDRKQIDSFIAHSTELRRALWLRWFENEKKGRLNASLTPEFGDLQIQDIEWLWDQNRPWTDTTMISPAMSALARLFDTSTEAVQKETHALPTIPADLRAHLAKRIQWAEDSRKAKAAYEEREMKKDDKTRAKNREWFFANQKEIENGTSDHFAVHVQQHLEDPDRKHRVDVSTLSEVLDDECIEIAKRGLKALWKAREFPAPTPGSNSIQIVHLAALSGLTLDVQEGLQLETLSQREAEKAARLALHELNSLPFWFDGLLDAHPATARDVIKMQLLLEWKHVGQVHDVLSHAPFEPKQTRKLVRELALAELAHTTPADVRTFEQVVSVLITSDSDAPQIIALADEALSQTSLDESWQIQWLRLLSHFSPDMAAKKLDALRRVDLKAFSDATLLVAAELASDTGRRSELVGRGFPAGPRALGAWIKLLFYAVSPKDDLEHEGVYSPGARDEAQDFRRRCLAKLSQDPSPEARTVLLSLANDADLTTHKTTFTEALDTQYEYAVEAASATWTEADVLACEAGDEKTPRNVQELFAMVLRHLRDVSLLVQNDDFSYRSLFKTADERDIQRWAASSLRERARGLYSVIRENVVDDNKEVDITAVVDGVGQVPIEIKLADGNSLQFLRDTMRNQLVGMYLEPATRSHGVLLVCRAKSHRWKIDKKMTGYDTLTTHLLAEANRLGSELGKVIGLASIDFLTMPSAATSRRKKTQKKDGAKKKGKR